MNTVVLVMKEELKMSDKNIKGNYENYEQFRLYLKEIICDCFQMGFSDKEIKEMYFDEYTKSNLVTYSYELVLLNIKYKTNNDEKTKNEIVVLAKKVENEFNKNDSTEKQATGEGQMSLVDETPEENKKLINKIIGYTKKSFSDYVSFSKEELEKLLDDEKKLKKKIDDLKKKLKKLDLEYDESKSYSDNEKIYKKAEDKKIIHLGNILLGYMRKVAIIFNQTTSLKKALNIRLKK